MDSTEIDPVTEEKIKWETNPSLNVAPFLLQTTSSLKYTIDYNVKQECQNAVINHGPHIFYKTTGDPGCTAAKVFTHKKSP